MFVSLFHSDLQFTSVAACLLMLEAVIVMTQRPTLGWTCRPWLCAAHFRDLAL